MDALVSSLRELAAKATKAPWVHNRFDVECAGCGESGCVCDIEAQGEIGTEYLTCCIQSCGLESFAVPNAALIVALRNSLDALLSRIEAADAMEEALEGLDICASFGCGYDTGRDMILHDEGCENIRAALAAYSAAKGVS